MKNKMWKIKKEIDKVENIFRHEERRKNIFIENILKEITFGDFTDEEKKELIQYLRETNL